MSKGTQRKLEIVAALSAETPLFIADELTEGLDAPSRLCLQGVITQLAPHRQFIVSSHDVGFIAATMEYVVLIDHGKAVDSFAREDVPGEVEFQRRVLEGFGVSAAADDGS